ncbi:MAG: Kae1-associated kinase Bud32 [Candidatus Thorarchaeota archaeon]|jgi:TP53 regulating kinase-like protein
MMEPWNIGAESIIYRLEQWGHTILLKHRPQKPYLLKEIDEFLRISRTTRECKMLTVARNLGVPTPTVYWVDVHRHSIAMEYIQGKQLKQLVTELAVDRLQEITSEFGRLISLLHSGGVVHGDPTTSNVIVNHTGNIWLVDFGLAEMNATVEMKGVDLHLMKRAFETTHWDFEAIMWDAALDGYKTIYAEETDQVLSRVDEIRERGRYH